MTKEKSTVPTIWCLFSIDSNYDQPDHNLVAWWLEKPTLERLASAFGFKLDEVGDETVVAIVGIWSGKDVNSIPYNDTSFRLREVEEGLLPEGRY